MNNYYLNYRGVVYPGDCLPQYFATLADAQAVRLKEFGVVAYNCAIINVYTGEDVAWKADRAMKD